MKTSLIGVIACTEVSRGIVYEGGTCLTDDLLLEVECSANDRDGIIVEVATVSSRGGVHSDEFL